MDKCFKNPKSYSLFLIAISVIAAMYIAVGLNVLYPLNANGMATILMPLSIAFIISLFAWPLVGSIILFLSPVHPALKGAACIALLCVIIDLWLRLSLFPFINAVVAGAYIGIYLVSLHNVIFLKCLPQKGDRSSWSWHIPTILSFIIWNLLILFIASGALNA